MVSKLSTTFFLLCFALNLISLSDAFSTPVSSTIEVLTDSGYFSMGLTLQLANKDLSLDDWEELTIFAPSDQDFSKSGQPSLLDIKYQLSPTRLSGETLRNLPNGAKIPTLRSNSSLVVTNSSRSGGKTSINNVIVQDSPVYDNGFVVIYGADEFFTAPMISDSSLNSLSSSSIPNPISSSSSSSSGSIPIPSSATRTTPTPNSFNIFESASRLLMSRGFVIIAMFHALQLEESSDNNDMKITVFAPIDEAIPNPTTKFSDYVTIFQGHVINRLLSWKDLQKLTKTTSFTNKTQKNERIERERETTSF